MVVVLPAEAERTRQIAGTSETPDTLSLHSAQDLLRLAEEYGEEGRAHYVRSRCTFDVAWLLVYGGLVALLALVVGMVLVVRSQSLQRLILGGRRLRDARTCERSQASHQIITSADAMMHT